MDFAALIFGTGLDSEALINFLIFNTSDRDCLFAAKLRNTAGVLGGHFFEGLFIEASKRPNGALSLGDDHFIIKEKEIFGTKIKDQKKGRYRN